MIPSIRRQNVKSKIYRNSNNDDLETTFVIVCPFFFLYHIFTFRSFCNTVRFSFESRKSRERERYFFILETLVEIVIRGKLARRDKLGLCFKCRERRGTKRKWAKGNVYREYNNESTLFTGGYDFYRIKEEDPFSPRNVH